MIKFTDFYRLFEEAFNDMGRLSPEKLRRGQRLDPDDDDNFTQVNGKVFYNVVSKIRIADMGRPEPKGLETLTVYDVKDYMNMKCFVGKNNSSGFAIKDGSELVSVFSSQESSGNALVRKAIEEGATHLDCYAKKDKNGNILNTGLVKLYRGHGFEIDKSLTTGKVGEPYSIQNGVSLYVNENEEVEPDNENVVVFMKLK
jgi:hypothetical protein